MIEPKKWASALGSLSDTVTLPDEDLQFASFKKLFPALTQVPLSEGGVAPQRTDFNTLFKLLGDNIFYLQQGGVFSYSNTADYERGAFVKYNNELYLCIQDNNSFNKHAPTDAEYWLRVALNNDLANYLPLAGGNITGNLTVQNKNVVRSVNGVNADDNGNVSITSINHATNADSATNATTADRANTLIGYDNHNLIYLGWDGNSLTMNVDGVDSTKGEVITHLNIGSQSVNHATTADSATNATNDSGNRNIYDTYALKSNYPDRLKFAYDTTFKGYVNVTIDQTTWGLITNHNISSQSVNHATTADSATNATNLGGYPATDYIRSVNGAVADKNGNVSDIAEKGWGYIRFTNGLQIFFSSVASTSPNISFPKPFLNVPVVVCGGDGNAHGWGTSNISSTGFTAMNSDGGPEQYCYFFAIGYWK